MFGRGTPEYFSITTGTDRLRCLDYYFLQMRHDLDYLGCYSVSLMRRRLLQQPLPLRSQMVQPLQLQQPRQ